MHTEIYHVAFPLKKSPDFTAMFTVITLAYLSSDIYRLPHIIWQLFLNTPCSSIFLVDDVIFSTR